MKEARLEWDGESDTCSMVVLRDAGNIVIHGFKVASIEDTLSDLWDDFVKLIQSSTQTARDET